MVRSLAHRALQIIAKADAAPSEPNYGSHSLIARLSSQSTSGSGVSTSGRPPASQGSAPGADWRAPINLPDCCRSRGCYRDTCLPPYKQDVPCVGTKQGADLCWCNNRRLFAFPEF